MQMKRLYQRYIPNNCQMKMETTWWSAGACKQNNLISFNNNGIFRENRWWMRAKDVRWIVAWKWLLKDIISTNHWMVEHRYCTGIYVVDGLGSTGGDEGEWPIRQTHKRSSLIPNTLFNVTIDIRTEQCCSFSFSRFVHSTWTPEAVVLLNLRPIVSCYQLWLWLNWNVGKCFLDWYIQ